MRRIFGIAAIALTLCFSQTSYGEEGNSDLQQNPSKTFNFESNNTTKDTTIGYGQTDIFFTCYELGPQDYYNKTNVWLDFDASSPEWGIECSISDNQEHYICSSDMKKAHTVKVTMQSGCSDPN